MTFGDSGTIAIDFDGVIHDYRSSFTSVDEVLDPPVEGALDFITTLLHAHYRVIIFSTRCREYPGHEGGTEAIKKWLVKHGMQEPYMELLEFSAEKHAAILYIDDHGWQFRGTFPSLTEIENFTTWRGKKSSTLPGGHNYSK